MIPRLSIIIPTYNERENIPTLLRKIFDVLKDASIDGEVIVVDDNSPDGTGVLLDDLAKDYSLSLSKGHQSLRVLHRAGKLGLSSAALEGFAAAKGDILAVMDADFSHPPEKLPEMFRLVESGAADMVIGSRYIPGGKIIGWGWYRKLLSWGATLLSRPFTRVKDTMTGYFMVKRTCIADDMANGVFNPRGFKILLEILVKGKCKNVREVPIVFVNRTAGKSKNGPREIFAYLKNLWGYLRQ
ncbi:MAG: polyprenol monophosphomannose synthase [bacterium]|nr:polyprenol monophosphomannose synthase [bacterium]